MAVSECSKNHLPAAQQIQEHEQHLFHSWRLGQDLLLLLALRLALPVPSASVRDLILKYFNILFSLCLKIMLCFLILSRVTCSATAISLSLSSAVIGSSSGPGILKKESGRGPTRRVPQLLFSGREEECIHTAPQLLSSIKEAVISNI